ncbi:MAG TPA: polysaccharide biosynthesis/export family protein, partial [Urbifossiella sp.]|nr:polysaccharide biosynthesis/export family protein [Urbifossiella sp.]
MRQVVIHALVPAVVVALLAYLAAGCVGPRHASHAEPPDLPRELNKVNLPDYVIEPPDVLVINAVRLVPNPPYRFEPLDTVIVTAKAPLANEPLSGEFVIEPEGTVNFGGSYGSVRLSGLTTEEARLAIEKQFKTLLANPAVYIAPSRTKPLQQVTGEHLVRPDGKVSLGVYGLVRVCGLTATEAKHAIEDHLRQFVLNPEVSVDVLGYNSKIVYIIYNGAGNGQQVYRLPFTGNETVLDAIGQLYGIPGFLNPNRIWVARPTPDRNCPPQILPVDWYAVTAQGVTTTNYQLLPGDRVYVNTNRMVA